MATNFMVMSNKDSNTWFKIFMTTMSPAIKEILLKNDLKSLKGIQSLSGFMGLNAALNSGSGVLVWLLRHTLKTYEPGKPLPFVLIRKIITAFPGLQEHRIRGFLDGLNKYGFVEYSILPGVVNEKAIQERNPDVTLVRLHIDVWKRYLNECKKKSKETQAYSELIGRILWSSFLAEESISKRGISCGVRSFKMLPIILNNVDSNGQFDIEYGETMCSNMGTGRFSQLIAVDNAKTEATRFFTEITDKKVKINDHAINVFNKILNPLYNQIEASLRAQNKIMW